MQIVGKDISDRGFAKTGELGTDTLFVCPPKEHITGTQAEATS